MGTGQKVVRQNLHSGFRVGSIDVDPLGGFISGAAAVRHLQPKVMDVLVCLAERAGELVERSEILERVWGRPTSDEVLTRCISELRTALDDNRGQPEYIQTVPKRGYRLIQTVVVAEGQRDSAEGRQAPARPPSPKKALASVAVLPFENHSPDASLGFLADAFATELHSTLARVDRLRVASRRSSLALRDSQLDAGEIGKRLGVHYLISGSLQTDGKEIRVTAQLDEADTGCQVWARRYDRQWEDILSIQQEVAEALVESFATQQQIAEMAWARQAPTSSLDAWGLVQKSRSMAVEYTVESLVGAITPLRQAIETDPDYAAAHATLASVLVEGLINGLSENRSEDEALARSAAEKAMALAPRDPFILKMVGLVWAYFGNHRKSAACLRKAVQIAPFDFGAWGYLAWPLTGSNERDDLAEAERILDRLISKEPNHPGVPFWLYHRSVAELCSGRHEAARRSIEEALELQPGFALGWMHYANTLGLLQRQSEARGALERCRAINPAMTTTHFRALIGQLCGSNAETIEQRTGGLPEDQAPK